MQSANDAKSHMDEVVSFLPPPGEKTRWALD